MSQVQQPLVQFLNKQASNNNQNDEVNQEQKQSSKSQDSTNNVPPPSVSDKEQGQPSFNSQFQRYQQKVESRTSERNQNRILYKSMSSNSVTNKQSSQGQSDVTQTYRDWKIYKNKSDLNMLLFPYCMEQSVQYKKCVNSPFSLLSFTKNSRKQAAEENQMPRFIPPLYKLKVSGKVQVVQQNLKQKKVYKPYFNYQKTPINQYLTYNISEQINMGIRQVQIVAEQIKRIKKQKQIATQNLEVLKGKQNKAIRIRIKRSYVKNSRGLYKTQADITKC